MYGHGGKSCGEKQRERGSLAGKGRGVVEQREEGTGCRKGEGEACLLVQENSKPKGVGKSTVASVDGEY